MITENTPVTIGALAAIFGIIAWLWREHGKQVDELHGRISKLKEELSLFRENVAKHYASDDRLQQTENKLTGAIEKLINRFDAFATDFNRYVGRVAKID